MIGIKPGVITLTPLFRSGICCHICHPPTDENITTTDSGISHQKRPQSLSSLHDRSPNDLWNLSPQIQQLALAPARHSQWGARNSHQHPLLSKRMARRMHAAPNVSPSRSSLRNSRKESSSWHTHWWIPGRWQRPSVPCLTPQRCQTAPQPPCILRCFVPGSCRWQLQMPSVQGCSHLYYCIVLRVTTCEQSGTLRHLQKPWWSEETCVELRPTTACSSLRGMPLKLACKPLGLYSSRRSRTCRHRRSSARSQEVRRNSLYGISTGQLITHLPGHNHYSHGWAADCGCQKVPQSPRWPA